LLKTASPGKIGDGKNFLSELEETIRANAQPALFQLTLNPQIDFRA
jgi:nitrogen regulatory protein PII